MKTVEQRKVVSDGNNHSISLGKAKHTVNNNLVLGNQYRTAEGVYENVRKNANTNELSPRSQGK